MSDNNPWISPVESEAEWQRKHLLLIFGHENAGPNWQYMNGLIRIACEHLGIAVTEVEQPKSKQLQEQAQQADNDFQAMGLLNKALREHRLEKFQDYIISLQQKGYDIVEDNHKYTIDTDTQSVMFGIIDYFPKANKVLIRKDNKWVKPGLSWIVKHLL